MKLYVWTNNGKKLCHLNNNNNNIYNKNKWSFCEGEKIETFFGVPSSLICDTKYVDRWNIFLKNNNRVRDKISGLVGLRLLVKISLSICEETLWPNLDQDIS